MADDDIFQDLFGAPAAVQESAKRARIDSSDDDEVVIKRKKRVAEDPVNPALPPPDDDMADFIVQDADGEQDRDEIISAGLGSASSSYDSDSADDSDASSSSEDDRAPKMRTHMDEVLNRLKKTKRKTVYGGADQSEQMENLVSNMQRAASDDLHDLEEGKPALHKISLLAQVEEYVLKKHWQESFIDAGGLRAFRAWLSLLPDGSLPNLTLRSTVLRLIERLLPSISIDLLKESQVGYAINDSYHHPKETSENKRVEYNLISHWLQILGRGRGESSAPTKATKEDMEAARRAGKPTAKPNKQTESIRAQIPRGAIGGELRMQPTSKVEPLERRDDVDTVLGRLKKKF
jgi:hypothetical protein